MNDEKKKKLNLKILIGILCIMLVIVLVIYNRQNNQEDTSVVTLGKVELICVNENNEPIIGEKFTLKDSEGKDLGEVESGTDGKVMFYSVPIGDYDLEVTQNVEGYEPEEKIKKVTVIGGETATVTFKHVQNKGNLLLVVTDQNGNPAEGIEYDLMDSNKQSIITISTHEKGLAGAKNLPLGTYYYKEKNEIYDKEIHEVKIEEKDEVVRNDISINK